MTKSVDLTNVELERLIYAMESANGDPALASKLLTVRTTPEKKPLVDQGWRDVAGDAIREGNFKKAVALLFEHAPEAMPYVSKLEALASAVKELLKWKFNQAGVQQHPEIAMALEGVRAKYYAYVDESFRYPVDKEHVLLQTLAQAVGEFISQADHDWVGGTSLSSALQTHDFAETWRLMKQAYREYEQHVMETPL